MVYFNSQEGRTSLAARSKAKPKKSKITNMARGIVKEWTVKVQNEKGEEVERVFLGTKTSLKTFIEFVRSQGGKILSQ